MYLIIKRILDLFIAIVALALLSPVFIIIILILGFTGERKIFYLQRRIGYHNQPFHIWKFSTMISNSPNIGTGEITLRNDPRVTSFGKFLRITKINELPQVFNVIKGDMSIVGPRPLMEVSFDLYTDEVKKSIYKVKPGITGIGSIIFRDEEKILSQADDPRAKYVSIFPHKAALEMWYIRHASLYVDVMIIFLTVWIVLFPHSRLPNTIFKDLPTEV